MAQGIFHGSLCAVGVIKNSTFDTALAGALGGYSSQVQWDQERPGVMD